MEYVGQELIKMWQVYEMSHTHIHNYTEYVSIREPYILSYESSTAYRIYTKNDIQNMD